jgi:ssDNA-binding Zn-finger/Zn-ribbon topoisomerase 1
MSEIVFKKSEDIQDIEIVIMWFHQFTKPFLLPTDMLWDSMSDMSENEFGIFIDPNTIKNAYFNYFEDRFEIKLFEKCPKCNNGYMFPKEGKYGLFVGCTKFPECNYIPPKKKKIDEDLPIKVSRNILKKCPKCNGLDIKYWRYFDTQFAKCMNNDCRWTIQIKGEMMDLIKEWNNQNGLI